jgi:hypothetical protein
MSNALRRATGKKLSWPQALSDHFIDRWRGPIILDTLLLNLETWGRYFVRNILAS